MPSSKESMILKTVTAHVTVFHSKCNVTVPPFKGDRCYTWGENSAVSREGVESMKPLTLPEAPQLLRMSRSSLYQRKDRRLRFVDPLCARFEDVAP